MLQCNIDLRISRRLFISHATSPHFVPLPVWDEAAGKRRQQEQGRRPGNDVRGR